VSALCCGGTAGFHSHAAPRRIPLPCAMPRALHSPFWGPNPVAVLCRGYIKRGCFWPKKKDMAKKCPGNYYSPPKPIWHLPTPRRYCTKLKAEPHVFMYRPCSCPLLHNILSPHLLNIYFEPPVLNEPTFIEQGVPLV
jgi:hypothetical protein